MHTRCPHCHQPVEIVDFDPLVEISCTAGAGLFDEEHRRGFAQFFAAIGQFDVTLSGN